MEKEKKVIATIENQYDPFVKLISESNITLYGKPLAVILQIEDRSKGNKS